MLMAISRFRSRRGVTPRLLRSDNGTNIVRANKEISEAAKGWDTDRTLQQELANRRVQWVFNTPGAPHTGGAWERQIRTVKKTLGAIIGDQVLDDRRLGHSSVR